MQLAAIVFAAAALVAGKLALAQAALDEVVVSGERSGPPLWHVSGEAHGSVAILGTVSPLPAALRWRAAEVRAVLGKADAVLLAKPLQVSLPRAFWMLLTQRDVLLLPGGRTLAEVLPPDLYARFAAQRAACGLGPHEWDRYRPLIAGALLEDAAFERHGLSQRLDVSLAVRRLARERHVAIEEVKVPGAPDLLTALRGIGADVEDRCLDAEIATVADGIAPLEERARAWARGDVDELRSLPASTQATCAGLLAADTRAGGLLAQTRREWLRSIEAELRAGGHALAVVDMDLLLGPDGLLAALRADGFGVEGP